MSELAQQASQNDEQRAQTNLSKYAALGGVVGALAASACCILPLALFSLGVTGAWMGRLTALSAYQPLFICLTVVALGCGYWLVYAKEKECAEGDACARPLPNRVVKVALWGATFLVLLAVAWPFVLPLILGE